MSYSNLGCDGQDADLGVCVAGMFSARSSHGLLPHDVGLDLQRRRIEALDETGMWQMAQEQAGDLGVGGE